MKLIIEDKRMKKLLIAGLVLALVGCGGEPEQASNDAQVSVKNNETVATDTDNEPASQVLNAERAVQAFKDAGLAVGQVVVYDEKTDPNKLLNRPNQYTQKVAFEDTTIEQPDPEFVIDGQPPFNGGDIEVFPTAELAQKRKEYVEMVTADMPMLQQYIYIKDTAVLRIEHDVLPSDAEKYNEVFQAQ